MSTFKRSIKSPKNRWYLSRKNDATVESWSMASNAGRKAREHRRAPSSGVSWCPATVRKEARPFLSGAPSPRRDTTYAEDWPVTGSLDLHCRRCMDTWAESIDVAEDWEIVRWDPCRACIDQWPLADRRLSDRSLAPAKDTHDYFVWRTDKGSSSISLPRARPSVDVACPVLDRLFVPSMSLEVNLQETTRTYFIDRKSLLKSESVRKQMSDECEFHSVTERWRLDHRDRCTSGVDKGGHSVSWDRHRSGRSCSISVRREWQTSSRANSVTCSNNLPELEWWQTARVTQWSHPARSKKKAITYGQRWFSLETDPMLGTDVVARCREKGNIRRTSVAADVAVAKSSEPWVALVRDEDNASLALGRPYVAAEGCSSDQEHRWLAIDPKEWEWSTSTSDCSREMCAWPQDNALNAGRDAWEWPVGVWNMEQMHAWTRSEWEAVTDAYSVAFGWSGEPVKYWWITRWPRSRWSTTVWEKARCKTHTHTHTYKPWLRTRSDSLNRHSRTLHMDMSSRRSHCLSYTSRINRCSHLRGEAKRRTAGQFRYVV